MFDPCYPLQASMGFLKKCQSNWASYLASRLARILAEDGVQVRALFRSKSNADLVHPNIELVNGDLTDVEKLPEIIDIDCGPIISGDKSVEEIGEDVLNYIIKLASGEINTKAMDLGQDDFMFWRRGVKL